MIVICDYRDYRLLFCLHLKLPFAETGSGIGLVQLLRNGLTVFFGLSVTCACAQTGFALHNVPEVAHTLLGAVVGTATRP